MMMVKFWLALLLFIEHVSVFCCAQELSDAPAAGDFGRRAWPRALVVGKYLYIEGGQVSQKYNGTYKLKTVESTLSLDLSQTWTPANASIREIRKDAPVVARQAIFADRSSNAFYTWGGYVKNTAEAQTQLRKFTADGGGGGSWSIDQGHDQGLASLRRSHGGAFVSTSDGGFYFGGFDETKDQSDATLPNGGFIPGFFYLNYQPSAQQQTWTNSTDAPYAKSGNMYAATAHFIPKYGSQGLVMLLGGLEYDSGTTKLNDIAMDIVWMMDIETKTWYSQKTTGDAPPRRRWPCTVGLQSLNNTYEVFMFGGNTHNRGFSDVWILSLPGFVWRQAAYTETPRTQMGCVLAGQRQMIVIGGINFDTALSQRMSDPDPWDQGLGIFDLTSLQWTYKYDPVAMAYDSPDIIKSWYSEPGNLAGVNFSQGVDVLLNPSANSGSSGSGDNPNTQRLSPAAMGGIVGGSIVVACLIGAAIFLLIRSRRKKARNAPEATEVSDLSIEPASKGRQISELSSSQTIITAELQANEPTVELDGQDAHGNASELDASDGRNVTKEKPRSEE